MGVTRFATCPRRPTAAGAVPVRQLPGVLDRPECQVGRESCGKLTDPARLPQGRGYHLHLQAPSQPLTGDTEARAVQINRELETLIRQCPSQYLWGYNRYKRPAGAPPPPGAAGAPA